jgi:hypothetical protein
MLKNSFMVVLLIVALCAVAAAADLGGTWGLDKAKSDPVRMGRGRQVGGGGQPPADIDVTLAIAQSADDIKITRTLTMGGQDRTSEQKYTLDGKECTNPAPMGRGEMVGKAAWEGGKLTITGKQKMSTPQGDFEIGVKEEYSLSEEGKVLTVMSTRTMPQGERTSKQVYNKK